MTKYEFKILSYAFRKKQVTSSTLHSVFSPGIVDALISDGYLLISKTDYKSDQFGMPVENPLPRTWLSLSRKGIEAYEANRWFDARYLITQVVIPLLVGVGSAVITALLLKI